MNVYDPTGGGNYTWRSVWFTFSRDAGSPNTFLDSILGSGGLSVSFSTTESGLTTCLFQVDGIASDPSNSLLFDGMVYFDAHW